MTTFTPHTDDEVREMLATIGAGSIDDLFEAIPPALRLDHPLDLAQGLSEQEVVDELGRLAERNRSLDELVCFAGRGAYDHYIPSVVWAIAGRSEFSTAYTPYQPELSQGVLQALFEYQSMICALTAMEVSNASLYDGATALVEAVRMSVGPGRRRVVLAGGVDPRLVETVRTYAKGPHLEIDQLGEVDGAGGLPSSFDADVAAVVIQHPNVHGILEDVAAWAEVAHAAGARVIEVFDPTSLGIVAPPGDLGVDIAVAEGQSLGNHLAFGGPYLGILAARMRDVRRMPGRIVGETVDVAGRPGYVLTLQAREQHIRREKATSNICTNQTLMAIAATIHLAWLGPAGLRELGERCAAKAAYALGVLTAVSGVEAAFPGAPIFKEFTVRMPRPASEVVDALVARGILAGVPAPWLGDDALIVAVTERRTRQQIDAFAAALTDVLA
ncbi:MAG TPA: aminomethyl-transferring glycine dehydrogenase subunit GcvPA [Actinomycetota bacterium]|nr:aminomethyl-transferring glycine dehydrogenase subunit GcvPA [Actinomycetota bacterium]